MKGPEFQRLEAWVKKEQEERGLKNARVSHLTNESVEEWNKLTEEERAKAVMDMIEAPVVPDPELV